MPNTNIYTNWEGKDMYCNHCGKKISQEARFCSFCGGPVLPPPAAPAPVSEPPAIEPEASVPEPEALAPDTATQPIEPEATGQPAEPACEPVYAPTVQPPVFYPAPMPQPRERRPLSKRMWYIIGGAAAVVVIALVLILAVSGARKKNYVAAIALYDAGGYSEAAEAFEALGKYKDSAECATLSRQWETYMRADELTAVFSRADTAEAAEIFASLGDFEDAAERAQGCRDRLDYDAAEAMEQEERYAEAQAAFAALDGYKDAAERARRCSDTLEYREAMELLNAGDYAAAAEKLAAPAESGFEDAEAQLTLCSNTLAYDNAIELFSNAKYYEAYKAFTLLGTFEDAIDRAKDCVRETPKSGQVYRNKAYSTMNTQLKVVNSSSLPSFCKLYSGSELVCTFFIRPGESAAVSVPAGIYSLNQAYGSKWFGPDDMFGDDGEYYKCKINGSYNFEMENRYNYTIHQGSGGDPVTSSGTERGAF